MPPSAAARATTAYLDGHKIEDTLNQLVILMALERPDCPWTFLALRLDALADAGGQQIATGRAKARTLPPQMYNCRLEEAEAHSELTQQML
mgnify:CR=1 FL=1